MTFLLWKIETNKGQKSLLQQKLVTEIMFVVKKSYPLLIKHFISL